MKRFLPAVLALSAAVAWAGAAAPAWPAVRGMTAGIGVVSAAGAGRPAGVWGRAIEVPGLDVLDKGGDAGVGSVSCASAGSCAAVGTYFGADQGFGFVAGERHGSWWEAIGVPGLAALSTGGSAEVDSVSCGSAGNCAAGGNYADGHRDSHVFVADERRRRWGPPVDVPGAAALSAGGVRSLSCASAGNCAVGGDYDNGHGNQAFVADERHGVWGTAIAVPGLVALNTGGFARIFSVSCASPGNCAAGGEYTARRFRSQGFVVLERHGVWGMATAVPGLAALNTDGDAEVDSVSCAPAGYCAFGGDYGDRRGQQGFVAAERHGRWRTIGVPGLAALNTGGVAQVGSVSCGSAGNCAAGGIYVYDRDGDTQGFVAAEKNGRWGRAIGVPGLRALSTGGYAEVRSLSCGSAGNCAAGGDYGDRRGQQGFVAVERHGRWGTAIEVPGLAALNKGGLAEVDSVSCAPGGSCGAGGQYWDRRHDSRGFVVSRTG
jgi:hypothetical protein